MLNIKSSDGVDLDLYEKIINTNTSVYIDIEGLNSQLAYDNEMVRTTYNRLIEYLFFASEESCRYIDKNVIVSYLTIFEHVPKSMFEIYDYNSRQTKISIDQAKVLKPLLAKGYATEFLSLYFAHTSYKSSYNNTKSMLNYCTPSDEVDRFGKPLVKLNFQYEKRSTGRLYANSYSVQTIPLKYVKYITVPKGRFLMWGDLTQVDLRVAWNIYLKDAESDKIYKRYQDKYEAFARIMNLALDKTFDLDEFLARRKLYKKLTLERCYDSNLQALIRDSGDPEFSKSMDTYYLNNVSYQKALNGIKKSIMSFPKFNTVDYFGKERPIDSSLNMSRKTKQAINTPVQSTSNDIVASQVIALYNLLDALNIPRDYVIPYMLRHDEMAYSLDERFKEYLWVFKDLSDIYVDDWDVIRMDMEFGYNYQVPDDELLSDYNTCVNMNLDKLTPHKPTARITQYKPYVRYQGAEFLISRNESEVVLALGADTFSVLLCTKFPASEFTPVFVKEKFNVLCKRLCVEMECDRLDVASKVLQGSSFWLDGFHVSTRKDLETSYSLLTFSSNMILDSGNTNNKFYAKTIMV